MKADLISRRLRLMLADWLSSNSTLRQIENEFEAEAIQYKPDPSSTGWILATREMFADS
jgi:hypothetical protein